MSSSRPLAVLRAGLYCSLLAGFLAIPLDSTLAADAILRDIPARIQRHRTSQVTLTLQLPDGTPIAANTPLDVAMVEHAFLFGANLFRFDDLPDERQREQYRAWFAELFNYATLPFYWQFYEQEPDVTAEADRRTVAAWCHERGIRCKGHPLVWVLEPEWVAKHPQGAERVFSHVSRETRSLQGWVNYWDVVNEPVVGGTFAAERNAQALASAYQTLGTTEVIRRAFEQARAGNPQGVLILNDFDTSRRFVEVARAAVAAGADIDAIGIQSHMHEGYWGAERLWNTCEQFRQLDLPIHFTELTIVSGRLRLPTDSEHTPEKNHWASTRDGELRQAAEVTELYRLLYSHPSVEAITWWDFTDQSSWMLAPSGLLTKQMKPKPAYRALKRLIREEWWTRASGSTSANGEFALQGHHGTYEVRLNDRGLARVGRFTLQRGMTGNVVVKMERGR